MKNTQKAERIEKLTNDLEKAVAEQEFHKAAQIRKKLDFLKGKKQTSKKAKGPKQKPKDPLDELLVGKQILKVYSSGTAKLRIVVADVGVPGNHIDVEFEAECKYIDCETYDPVLHVTRIQSVEVKKVVEESETVASID